MGEERKDKKKLKYEQPRLVNLTGAKSAGACTIGSSDTAYCSEGNTAPACFIGGAGGICSIGSGAD